MKMQSSNHQEKVETLKQMKRYIDEHLDGSVTGESVAKQFGYPYMTLRRFVQEVGGFTIHNYIRLRRIQKAAALLRAGESTTKAAKAVGFETLSGFNKAFLNVYGVTSSQYAETRGRCLMKEPQLTEQDGFYVVGYLLEAPADLPPEDRDGYRIGQDFPDVPREEFGLIGGSPDNVAIWIEWEKKLFYVIGPTVRQVRHVPEKMKSHWVPGGQFLMFRVPESRNNTYLSDNIRAVWWYACRQWLPESVYRFDETRLAYEYYNLDENLIYIPVRRRRPPNEGI